MARPKLKAKQQKTRQFNFRLNEDEYQLIHQAAGGYPPATWARVELLRLAQEVVSKQRKGGAK